MNASDNPQMASSTEVTHTAPVKIGWHWHPVMTCLLSMLRCGMAASTCWVDTLKGRTSLADFASGWGTINVWRVVSGRWKDRRNGVPGWLDLSAGASVAHKLC